MPLWLGCAIGERIRTSGQEPQRSGGFSLAPAWLPAGRPAGPPDWAGRVPSRPQRGWQEALRGLASSAGRPAGPRRRAAGTSVNAHRQAGAGRPGAAVWRRL